VPGRDGGVVDVALDGDEVAITVLRTLDGPSEVRVERAGNTAVVAVPPLRDDEDDPFVVVRAAAPAPGTEATYSIASNDALLANDVWIVERIGGVRRVRLSGPGAPTAVRTRGLLTALGIDIRDDPLSPVDAEIVVGGAPAAPAGSDPPRLQLAAAPGSDSFVAVDDLVGAVSGARVSSAGVLADAAPDPSVTLAATGRVRVAHGPLLGSWRDGRGVLAAALPRRVVVALDPESPRSEWSRAPSFPVLVLVSLEHLVGGRDRLQTLRGLPPSEAWRRSPPPPPADSDALLPLVRAATSGPRSGAVASRLAACGACLLVAAVGLSLSRARRFSSRAGTPRTAG